MTPFIDRPLTEQVAALKTRQTSAEELWHAAHERIGRLNDHLAAFIELAAEPRWDEDPAERLLAGVPIAVKANIAVEHLAHSAGVRALAHRHANADAVAVRRLRSAGAVVIGTTNMAEAALGAVSDNPWFGTVRNPLDPSRTAGGSSGGSAAAVAAGMASAALGSDTMGSVRIPAAYCGLVGLKPSPEAVPTGGLTPLSDLLDTVGPLGRTVADVATLFSVLAGQPVPVSPPPSLRVAVLHAATEIDVEVAEVFADAIEQLRSRVGGIGQLNLDLDPRRVRLAGLLDVEAGALEHFQAAIAEHPEGFSAGLLSMLDFASGKSAVELVRAQRTLRAAARVLDSCFRSADVLVCPTVRRVAPSVDAAEDPGAADLTAFANAAGVPAISLPLAGNSGQPVGMQLIGSRGSDATLLAVAAMVERAIGGNPVMPVGSP